MIYLNFTFSKDRSRNCVILLVSFLLTLLLNDIEVGTEAPR